MFEVTVFYKDGEEVESWDAVDIADLKDTIGILAKPSMYGTSAYYIRINKN